MRGDIPYTIDDTVWLYTYDADAAEDAGDYALAEWIRAQDDALGTRIAENLDAIDDGADDVPDSAWPHSDVTRHLRGGWPRIRRRRRPLPFEDMR